MSIKIGSGDHRSSSTRHNSSDSKPAQANDERMKRRRQQRQQDLPRIRLDHRGFMGDVRHLVRGRSAKHVPFGLQGSPQLHRPVRDPASDNDRLHCGIGEDFFHVPDRLPVRHRPAGAGPPRRREGRNRRSTACRPVSTKALRHVETVGMVAQKCKTHEE